MPRLKKALGQHHLLSGHLCLPLLEFLRPAASRVLEVGPGGGILTAELLAVGAHVLAWELDPEWAFELRRRVTPASDSLALVLGDALEIPWQHLPPGTLAAGNLPYQIATSIIRKLLEEGTNVPRAAFLVQKEVAERLAAMPGSKAYGALSVLTAARSQVRVLGRLRPGSFRPPPKVESAYVGLVRRPPPLAEEQMAAFTELVHQAFAQRRKTLRNSLAGAWGRPAAGAALAAAGLDGGRRAETLSLSEFVSLFHARQQAAAGDGKGPPVKPSTEVPGENRMLSSGLRMIDEPPGPPPIATTERASGGRK